MLKKYFTVYTLALTLLFANLTYAEHSPEDKYEAMCQSTGSFSDIKYPIKDLAKNKEARVLQLFGYCGEQPNLLIIDYITPVSGNSKNRNLHSIQVWQSPEQNYPYWHFVYNRHYVVDSKNKILKTHREECSKTSFINVEIPNMMQMTVNRYCSAKVGSPIFPHAQGNLVCKRGADEPNLLEQGYMDYLKDTKKHYGI